MYVADVLSRDLTGPDFRYVMDSRRRYMLGVPDMARDKKGPAIHYVVPGAYHVFDLLQKRQGKEGIY